MGHAFKCCLRPSNASVPQDSLVSSSYSAGCWYNIDDSSVTMTMQTLSLSAIVPLWSLTGESDRTNQFFMMLLMKGSWKDFAASQFHEHSHVLCLQGATIFGKGQSWKLQKAIYLLKISISLWALNLIPLDVIFVIIIYEGASSNQTPHVTTSDMPL